MRDDLNLSIPLLADLYNVSQVADAPFDLDLVVKELFEGRNVEDLVRGWLGGIDDELRW